MTDSPAPRRRTAHQTPAVLADVRPLRISRTVVIEGEVTGFRRARDPPRGSGPDVASIPSPARAELDVLDDRRTSRLQPAGCAPDPAGRQPAGPTVENRAPALGVHVPSTKGPPARGDSGEGVGQAAVGPASRFTTSIARVRDQLPEPVGESESSSSRPSTSGGSPSATTNDDRVQPTRPAPPPPASADRGGHPARQRRNGCARLRRREGMAGGMVTALVSSLRRAWCLTTWRTVPYAGCSGQANSGFRGSTGSPPC